MKCSTMLMAASLVLAPVTALAHAQLDHAAPAAGATVAVAPKDVTLSFTEAVEPKFSSIVVQDAQGKSVHDGKAMGTPGNTAGLTVKLRPLPPGVYKVIWKMLSVDTHRTQGTFSFTIGP